MLVVHISGTPGSGKTTLGQKFETEPQIAVVDTDELLTEEDDAKLQRLHDLGKTGDARIREWRKLFRKRLREAYDLADADHKTILIFTGILDHASPPPSSFVEMPFATMGKYFLKVPTVQLLQQFYGRYTKELASEGEFWEGVAVGRYVIPSSEDYLKGLEHDKQWHLTHGYKLVSANQIEKKIKSLLKWSY